jgi:hypothetical protein
MASSLSSLHLATGRERAHWPILSPDVSGSDGYVIAATEYDIEAPISAGWRFVVNPNNSELFIDVLGL